ncbi:procollagen galactosyltransferase 2-like isoform X2 [Actinia tenebrosa]|uniref:Procollagen galactosyltransferase 2-like isoform X2 n=1 Tax=Actinia tenebrosa TaxID=6105 RepID=A0A6P8HZM8_ACTTE|nr:procollagen galactosyltransferase 2-like isoform X2 [Actinia tenebrosa]
MRPLIYSIFLASTLFVYIPSSRSEPKTNEHFGAAEGTESAKDPTVLLSVIARNVAHLLPNWLGYIENLDYPKDRISIWIATDHNVDNTSGILKEWANNVAPLYHRVLINATDSPTMYSDASFVSEWSELRYQQVASLRQQALDAAREQWADYLFVVDCDNFLFNASVLRDLMAEKKTVVAPLIPVFQNQSAYSNFWGGMDEDGYYKRTDEYFPVLYREIRGCFDFPMIHSTYLVDLRQRVSSNLTYYPPPPKYKGEVDDILIFAYSARTAGIKLHLINRDFYGYMVPPIHTTENLPEIQILFTDLKLEYLVDHPEELMLVSPHVSIKPIKQDKLGLDEIYMINLKRRPLRRRRMLASLKELGIDVKLVDAVDGNSLTIDQIKEMGIKMLPGYFDPYSKRALTMGEIGCFLSHYFIWEEMLNKGLNNVLVLEDDVRFESNFRRKVEAFLDEAFQIRDKYPWELIYLGRKKFLDDSAELIGNGSRIAWADYSYWTIGYILSLSGSRKLIAARPLHRMLALDEFLPIMYNRHSNKEWSSYFEPRNLVAMTAEPLLIYPTHYIGDHGYFSDTETESIVPDDVLSKKEEL